MDNTVIKVSHVSKDFLLPHEKVNSIKRAFTNLAKRGMRGEIETQHALKNVDFTVHKGEFFGIVGRNGSGKSTLLKILAGIYQPTHGKVHTVGKLVPFIELGVGFNPELTGRENVFLNGAMLGFSYSEVEAMYDDIVSFAELERFMDQKLKNYSSGMQVRLAFSMATRSEADILLIDEVLAVGDADFQRKCFAYFKKLKKNKKTVVFVSHDMGAVREFCDRALLIDSSEVQAIGDTKQIASLYSKLFIREETAEDEEEEDTTNVIVDPTNKRWGNGKIKADSVTVRHDGDYLDFTVKATANTDLDGALYGLHIIAQDGQEITAMNNRMVQQPDLKNVKAGATVLLRWRMLNIFNDGDYTATVTFVDEAGTTFDWFTDAAAFKVRRPERSTTAVLPPISVEASVSN